MSQPAIDLTSLRKALGQLIEALQFWQREAQNSALKPHLRSAVIQSFEFTYELSVRSLRRVLIERSESVSLVADLSFNDLVRKGADAGLLADPAVWRTWREMRNVTSHAYNEVKAEEVATHAGRFAQDASELLTALERSIGS